jgi:hypothetical protein
MGQLRLLEASQPLVVSLTDDPLNDVAAKLLTLAAELGGSSPLQRARVLDGLSLLAGELRDDEVRAAKPHTTWSEIGRYFGVTQQAAQKRWGL